MTYSVVAGDPATGAVGVAVQSHSFQVGRAVPWARAGVGAVATQATTEPTFGPRGLNLLEGGLGPSAALEQLLSADARPSRRQVAIVDAAGRVAAHTGRECVRSASHLIGSGWSVQGNLLHDDSVVPAMAEACREAGGSLEERLLRTLEAGEASGGDLRGAQSAHLKVAFPGDDDAVDVGVADHPRPVAELRRLVELSGADRALRRARRAAEEGSDTDALAALRELERRRHGPEQDFWSALVLGRLGHWEEAASRMDVVLDGSERLAEVLARLAEHDSVAVGLLRRLGRSS